MSGPEVAHHGLAGAFKRAFDFVAALAGMIIAVPVMAVVALIVALAFGRPVLFRQERIGLGGRRFTLPKFRTMTNERDASGALLPDDQRLTATGRLLRRFRVDELPGLLAVLTGELSLVGPRPLPEYVLKTIPGSELRQAVVPGFTGLAQVSGATLLANDEKLALDLYYIRHWSLAGDFLILLRTVGTIVLGEHRDEALIRRAMDECRGSIPARVAPRPAAEA